MQQRDDWHLTEAIGHEAGRGDPFAAAVRATRMPMVITDPNRADNPIIFCNEAFQHLTGYARDEIVGRNCRFLQGPATDRAEVGRIRHAIAAGEAIDVDLLNYRKDGSTFWNALYLSPVRDHEGRIRFYFASQLDISDRIEAHDRIAAQKAEVEREVAARTADLEAALEEKTLLLHEVDHRVKNNLTMIGSLLRLQARGIDDPVIAAQLEAMLERIDALATVHRRLYQSTDIKRFDIGAFCANLAADVIGASGRSNIALEAEVVRVEVASAKASALGLVLNEVLTNAVKHAYADGRGGTLKVAARSSGGTACITITDDGPGTTAPDAWGEGLGRTLIHRLTRQVGATATWDSAGGGTTGTAGTIVTIRFPVSP